VVFISQYGKERIGLKRLKLKRFVLLSLFDIKLRENFNKNGVKANFLDPNVRLIEKIDTEYNTFHDSRMNFPSL